jgi:hypothetical protein
MTELEKQIRDKFSMGIAPLSDSKPDLQYREWSIYLLSPNGGILGIDLVHQERNYYFAKETYPQFDYADSESIFKYAKDLINQIEDFMASADGQQLNFNLSVLKEVSEDVLE